MQVDQQFDEFRRKLRSFEGVVAGRRAAGLRRHAARLPAGGPGLAALPPRVPLRRLPGRRHGPGQDRPGAGPAGIPPHANRCRQGQTASRRWSSCPRAWCSTGSRRRPGSRRSCACWTTPAWTARHAARAACADYDLIVTTYGTLRRDIAELRKTPVRLRDPRRIPGDQERQRSGGQGLPAAAGRPSPGHDRHAGREPPRRTVVAVRVPQPGHARPVDRLHVVDQDRTQSRGRRRRAAAAGPRAAALHPPPHQGAGADRAAREDRADAVLRAGAQAAEAVRRAARLLPLQPEPAASPRWA